jgi:integrase
VPTLEAFASRFVDNYARANRHKASGVAMKESILKCHLVPLLGAKKLDAISDEDIQSVKRSLKTKKSKTVNNVLSVLNTLLKIAAKWKVIEKPSCSIELLKVSNLVPGFYEFAEYARLVEAAEKIGTREAALVLLGGDAGLRRGEMIGLRWCDVDFRRNQLVIQQAVWKGIVDTPKSGRGRIIPMTNALAAALTRLRHLRGERVFYANDGTPVTERILRGWVASAQKRAQLATTTGALHILRHTFCSHLAMRGAPAKAIQELAGHEDLTTTLRYMHLSPSARESAIALLDGRDSGGNFGEIVETAAQVVKSLRFLGE